MIKLFRNIRQNLLNEGKTSKYFKYAIGEIILVVIGILIALQLNSWKESNTERSLEKEYIVSLIEDIKKDSQNFDIAIMLNQNRIKNLDSLALLCFNYTKEHDAEIFYRYMVGLRHPDFVSQTDRTLSQLRNAGGMRLISKRNTADAIIKYEDYYKKLTNQQTWYEGMLKDMVNAGIHTFNFNQLPKYIGDRINQSIDDYRNKIDIESPNAKMMIELGNITSTYSSITGYYIFLLQEGKQNSLELIKILEKDYLKQ